MYLLVLPLRDEQERPEQPEAGGWLGEPLHVHRLRAGLSRRYRLPRMAQGLPVPGRHLLSEMPEGHETPSRQDSDVLRVPVLRPSGVPDAGNDLRGLGYLAQALVPRDLPHEPDAVRDQRQAD